MDRNPAWFLLGSLLLFWIGIMLGWRVRTWCAELMDRERKMTELLGGAMLTLFGLLMGFTFSMAVSRYDLRRQLLVREANAIGSTWQLTEVLDEPVRSEESALLRQYVPERVRFLERGQTGQQVYVDLRRAGELQDRMWAVASSYAYGHRDPVTGQYLANLSQTLSVAEERTAANEDRIPAMAWLMLLFVGFAATVLVELNAKSRSMVLRIAFPVVLAGVLWMTMDMDSPHHGLIHLDQSSMLRLEQQIGAASPQLAR